MGEEGGRNHGSDPATRSPVPFSLVPLFTHRGGTRPLLDLALAS